jgi:hypothetical protein
VNRTIIIIILSGIAVCSAYIGLKLHNNSLTDKLYKADYYTVNQIKYGLLSGDKWTYQVNRVISQQVDSFSLSGENKKVLTAQVNKILNRVFDEADVVLHKKQENVKDRIKFRVINTFVDLDKFREEIPRFSNAIVDELDKSKNKNQLKNILKDKVTSFLNSASQDTIGEQQITLRKYNALSIKEFNSLVAEKTLSIREEQKMLAYVLIGLLSSVLLLWIYILRVRTAYAISFLLSVVISFISLYIGVSLPMIEIDARIGTLDLNLLASHIIFQDQVIFFQTKSILDVIHILLRNGKADSVFVGCLILLFSVIFPVIKLICTSIYLFIKEKSNRFIKYMAFNSGKWSMADVMVVAIFMAYVGFQGILDDQLADITVHKESINLITTNRTNLQAGFIIFVAFVLFNLILVEILKRITKNEGKSLPAS